MSSELLYTKSRLRAFLAEARHLLQSEFPYDHSSEGLLEIVAMAQTHLATLESIHRDAPKEVIRASCKAALVILFEFVPYLGFMLRSTNVRNAFEVYGPLLRLARKLLGEDVKLILSSEWDYSPYVYYAIPTLSDYVLIGLPATESGNPLVIPLVGHEFGHAIWGQVLGAEPIESEVEDEVVGLVTGEYWKRFEEEHQGIDKDTVASDLLDRNKWLPAFYMAARQCEELFCDLVGLRVFGRPFVQAFAYLLAPGPERKGADYPDTRKRVEVLLQAAQKYGIPVPGELLDEFVTNSPPMDLLSEIADAARERYTERLMAIAERDVENFAVNNADASRIQRIAGTYQQFVSPISEPGSLQNILCAGWDSYLKDGLWKERPEIEDPEETLHELMLKSCEILEVQERIRG